MPQQDNLLVAQRQQFPELRLNSLWTSAALPPPHMGHHTIRTKIIAAIHHGQPATDIPIPRNGQPLHNLPVGTLVTPLKDPFAGGQNRMQKLRQAMDHMGAKHQVDVRIALADFFLPHAPAPSCSRRLQ